MPGTRLLWVVLGEKHFGPVALATLFLSESPTGFCNLGSRVYDCLLVLPKGVIEFSFSDFVLGPIG